MQTSASHAHLKKLVTLAMMSAIAFAVMWLSKLLPSVNGFLDFDFKHVIICIGGFIYGPLASVAMSVVVAFVEMITVSHTGIIGFVMNVVGTCSFCFTATLIYKKRRTLSGAILGLAIGTCVLTAVMLLWNYFLTPIYQGVPREAVAAMLLPIYLPFNLTKGALNMAATLLLYRPVVIGLRKAGLAPPSQGESAQGQTVTVVILSVALAVAAIACVVLFLPLG